MTKNELLQIHGLAKQVKNDLEERSDQDIPDEIYEDYNDLGVSAVSINKRKGEHKNAVFELFSAIADAQEFVLDSEGESGDKRAAAPISAD